MQPNQPLYTDENEIVRFKSNEIVLFLLNNGPHSLNTLALLPFNDEDRAQFAQLIGYSLPGFGDLDYVSNEKFESVRG